MRKILILTLMVSTVLGMTVPTVMADVGTKGGGDGDIKITSHHPSHKGGKPHGLPPGQIGKPQGPKPGHKSGGASISSHKPSHNPPGKFPPGNPKPPGKFPPGNPKKKVP
ncbi:hypothetical protein ANME2D_00819 [Candidatus Methanoperedens nitroreducens]|uniref:Uncharacterized protein n=1 Tax=Candidatus Methanoperedens nitratireducens TaxID=1392998 RepID=A0A062V4Z8_9EURY|nr:hypothetical protein [Candidatus Methanoperedens nitroreducens]KCZ72392.1 hypothetical protein ANME2D_00819 [Candidatus Methanoperedens nitroreducens]MDJ1423674.1 hypothetical protein [Candidatus Methanoperedens sp.]